MQTPTWGNIRAHPAFVPCIGGALAILLSLPLLCFDFWFDQGVFAAVADTIIHGGVAYRDAWEHKPPGIFYVYAAAFLLLGRDIWAVRVVEILGVGLASAGLACWGERHLASRRSGIAAAVLLPLLYLPFAPNTAQPETFQVSALAWALALWPRDPAAVTSDRRCLATGALVATATLFKTPAAFFAFGMLSDRLACDLGQRTWPSKLRLCAWTLAGLSAPVVLFGAYYAMRGALAPFWDALLVFPAEYARASGSPSVWQHLERSWSGIGGIPTYPESALLLVGIVQGAFARRAELARVGVGLLTAWATVILQGRYFQYHWIPLLPFLAALMAMGFVPPAEEPGFRRRAGKILLGATLSLALLSLATEYHRSGAWYLSVGDVTTISNRVPMGVATPWGESREVAKRIDVLTGPEDPIFVWGDAPLLYFLSDRRMAGPYPHLMTLIPEWRGPQRVHALLAAFTERSPQLIVIGRGGLWWRRSQEPGPLLDAYPDMKRMLLDRYRKAEMVEGFELWLRTD
jgi:hypothetical protein